MPLTKDILLIYLPTPAPPSFLTTLATKFPSLTIRWIQTPVIQGQLIPPENIITPEQWSGVTLLCIYHVPRAALIPGVRFVQAASAGTDAWVGHERFMDGGVVFANASGCQPPQIAEWVIGAYLSHKHHFRVYAEQQKERVWHRRLDLPVEVSTGRRVGILGYGGIGRQTARLASSLGMSISAYTLNPRTSPTSRISPPTTYTVPSTGDPSGLLPTTWFSGAASLRTFLSQPLDLLVVSLPLTPATRNLLGPEEFRLLGEHSQGRTFVANVARGAVVDSDALVHALETGLIGGAALDVTEPEPLPEGHALWSAPNLFLTPHVAWQSTQYWDNLADLLLRNLERLDAGETVLNEEKRETS